MLTWVFQGILSYIVIAVHVSSIVLMLRTNQMYARSAYGDKYGTCCASMNSGMMYAGDGCDEILLKASCFVDRQVYKQIFNDTVYNFDSISLRL